MNSKTVVMDDDSEHELSYYLKDKVKLMKEVLKLIKPKKIKSMAPDCIKDLSIVEINSMLLEELLGISNKRLQYIFKGDIVDRETSSSDSEDIDVISLDDISDDDIVITLDEDETNIDKKPTLDQLKNPKIKTEKRKRSVKTKSKVPKIEKVGIKETNKNQLMSVLELLELQARARAIRSQLAIENERKADNTLTSTSAANASEPLQVDDEDSDAVIVDSPISKEIVITDDSENENEKSSMHAEESSSSHNETANVVDITDSTASNNLNTATEPNINSQEIERDNIDLTSNELDDVIQIASSSKSNGDDSLGKRKKIVLIRNKSYDSPKVADSNVSNKEVDSNEISCDDAGLGDAETTNKTDNVVIKVENNVRSCNIVSKMPVNDCDDEIVINLDDDEMDAIENV